MLKESAARQKTIEFESRFGRGAEIGLFFAPGRINLIGEFTNVIGGKVLSFATEQGTYAMLRKSGLSPSRLYSETFSQEVAVDQSDLKKMGDWADFIRGVCKYSIDACGKLPPFDAYYFGDLPVDAGLSSSSSFCVATCLGLSSLGCDLDKEDIFKIARRAEYEFVNINSPVNDQLAVLYGKQDNVMLVNCEDIDYRHVPFNIGDVEVVVAHSEVRSTFVKNDLLEKLKGCEEAMELLQAEIGNRKSLSEITIGEFERTRWSLPDELANLAGYIIYENARVEEAAACVEKGDKKALGHLMNRSHESFRDLFGVVHQDLETLKEIADSQPGVWGSRMASGAIGGCVIAVVDQDEVEHYMRRIPNLFWQATCNDTQVTSSRPGNGARQYGVS
ncbi:MAG: hypothetical protein JXA49_05130 [Actinobacteria bacterium]|nr:hypothetical protein [Actinomycetota bacterium]